MKSRREFLKIATAGAAMAPFRTIANVDAPPMKPVVLSTWNFGMNANREAWKILSSGGRALDAVEAGARHTESAPSVQTVGYGACPDRAAHVTLDSCIMVEQGICGSVGFVAHIEHRVSVARMVMDENPHVMHAGEGAVQFALANVFKKEKLQIEPHETTWKQWLK